MYHPEPARVIPVLDFKDRQVVHAVGGDRDHYRPVVSRLHPGADPVGMARALAETLGLRTFYLADLDAIAGAPPALDVIGTLRALDVELWVDAGVRSAGDVDRLLSAGVACVVAGSETVPGPAVLEQMLGRAGSTRLIFSLDLRRGRPLLAPGAPWGGRDAHSVALSALRQGIHRLLLLDLSRVGTGRGLRTLELARSLRTERQCEVAVGGGIATADDIDAAARAGAWAVLVASAIHSGAIRVQQGRVVRTSTGRA